MQQSLFISLLNDATLVRNMHLCDAEYVGRIHGRLNLLYRCQQLGLGLGLVVCTVVTDSHFKFLGPPDANNKMPDSCLIVSTCEHRFCYIDQLVSPRIGMPCLIDLFDSK